MLPHSFIFIPQLDHVDCPSSVSLQARDIGIRKYPPTHPPTHTHTHTTYFLVHFQRFYLAKHGPSADQLGHPTAWNPCRFSGEAHFLQFGHDQQLAISEVHDISAQNLGLQGPPLLPMSTMALANSGAARRAAGTPTPKPPIPPPPTRTLVSSEARRPET